MMRSSHIAADSSTCLRSLCARRQRRRRGGLRHIAPCVAARLIRRGCWRGGTCRRALLGSQFRALRWLGWRRRQGSAAAGAFCRALSCSLAGAAAGASLTTGAVLFARRLRNRIRFFLQAPERNALERVSTGARLLAHPSSRVCGIDFSAIGAPVRSAACRRLKSLILLRRRPLRRRRWSRRRAARRCRRRYARGAGESLNCGISSLVRIAIITASVDSITAAAAASGQRRPSAIRRGCVNRLGADFARRGRQYRRARGCRRAFVDLGTRLSIAIGQLALCTATPESSAPPLSRSLLTAMPPLPSAACSSHSAAGS